MSLPDRKKKIAGTKKVMIIPGSPDELDRALRDCKSIIARRSIISGFSGALPIPIQDVAIDVYILTHTLPKINARFGLAPDQIRKYDDYIKLMIYKAIKEAGVKLAGRLITKEVVMAIAKRMGIRMGTRQLSRFVPVIGQIASAVISYGGMKLILNEHIRECYKVSEIMLSRNLPQKPAV